MKKYRRLLTLLLAAVMLLALSACGQTSTPANAAETTASAAATTASAATTAETTASAATTAASAGPRTITDMAGRQVEIPGEIDAIATVGCAARWVTYAGAADKLIGCTELEISCPAGMPYTYANSEIFSKCTPTGSGGSGDANYVEEIVTLAPDVVFSSSVDASKLDELQTQIGIPVIGVYATSFNSADFPETLALIGDIMGTGDHASAVIDAIQGWLDDLDTRTKDIPDADKPTVYPGAVSFSGGHGFEGTFGQYPPFVVIHAKNVVDETGEKGGMTIDLEKVTTWDPDYIFLNPGNMSYVEDDYKTNAAFYESLSAVKNGNVYAQVNFNYFSCNMELAIVDAYYAATIIYPDQFADVDFTAKAEEVFNTMLGCNYLNVLDENGLGFGQITIGE
ncbi:MAG: ABC transporter substrate-binding protein [Oscillospiraceae bacterium]|nr:ABC transporter substrate-binding protein [Oscillospiraceae bacterium]